MKNILLISFYFEPCTLTPSQRITFWAKNIKSLGYYPTIITREWTSETFRHTDTKKPLGSEIRHEKYDTHEVYYLPYVPGFLDTAYLKFGETRLRPIFILSRILDVILAGITLKGTSFANFLDFSSKLLTRGSYDYLLISGEPFYLFKIGYSLHRRFGIPWIADYRDDWTTNELQMQKNGGLVRRWIAKIESSYERKWVGTAHAIVSVSELYTHRIATLLGKKGYTIENGFEDQLLQLPPEELEENFTITYSGVLYPSQNLSLILGVLQRAYDMGCPFYLRFLGAAYDQKEKRRIEELIPVNLRNYVSVTARLPRKEALKELQKSQVFLAMAYGDMKGIPSSKLYEYLALGKPVLLCPSDGDIMEEILRDSGLAFIANSVEEGIRRISEIRELYSSGRIEELKVKSRPRIDKYSRFNQLKKINHVFGQ